MTIFFIFKYGMSRDRNYYKKNTLRIVIISLLSYFIFSYSLGLITGFYNNFYNLSFLSIISNISLPLTLICCEEIIRYIYAKNSQYNKNKYIYLTVIFIFLDIIMEFSTYYLESHELIFIFICTVVLPCIFKELLYSFVTYKVSFVPSLVMRITLELSRYLLPIFPNLGNYINSVIGVIYPIFVYLTVNNAINKYDKDNKYVVTVGRRYLFYPILIISLIIVFLVSGLGKYKMIAIGSGSMEPIYYRGDAVIYKKISDPSQIDIGNIIAYEANNILVTHRVAGIDKKNNEFIFLTKGDNNKDIDNYDILEKNVKGIVVYKIPYIGMPSIWVQEFFNNL